MSGLLMFVVALPAISFVSIVIWDTCTSKRKAAAFFEEMGSSQSNIGSPKWYEDFFFRFHLPLFVLMAFVAVLIVWVLMVAITQAVEFSDAEGQLFRYGVGTAMITICYPLAVVLWRRRNDRHHRRMLRLKMERAGYAKADFMQVVAAQGIPTSLASDFYDYLQLWGKQFVPHFPIRPDDPIEELYGVELWASDLIEFYAKKFNCRLPEDPNAWTDWPDHRDESVEGFLRFLTPYYDERAANQCHQSGVPPNS